MLPASRHTFRQIIELINKRNRQIKYYLHVASKRIIELLVIAGIGTLIVGKNKNWKQQVALASRPTRTLSPSLSSSLSRC